MNILLGLGLGLPIFLLAVWWWLLGWRNIKGNEVGLVEKRWGSKKLPPGELIALNGECGYEGELLPPGWQWVPFLIKSVTKHPVVEIGSDDLGLVIAQVGAPLPVGSRVAISKEEFGDYQDVFSFLRHGGQKGKQSIVLRPGVYRIHPAAFLVLTPQRVHGMPMDPALAKGAASVHSFGLEPAALKPVTIRAQAVTSKDIEEHTDPRAKGKATRSYAINKMGVVTSHEGPALEGGQLACRLGGWEDIASISDPKVRITKILDSKNTLHKAYQDFAAFLEAGGQTGLQHDVITEGTYYANPWLVRIEELPVLHVLEGEVAVVKAKVGLVESDISGADFKFGSIVMPGHRGLWCEAIHTGSWLLNPRCYETTIVPTKILTLYWADGLNAAGKLDQDLKTIRAKSRDGFEFQLELQVQIHISDIQAPRVISMVGSVENLVNEVLQSAVGNYFRNKVQSMQATAFIQERERVQEEALAYIREKLKHYEVETLGVFLQDIRFPEELATVLKQREIAAQEVETFEKQRAAQEQRILTEAAKGKAEQQAALAQSEVAIAIRRNEAEARRAEAEGQSYAAELLGRGDAASIQARGLASAEATKAQGLALAAGLDAQKRAVGESATMLVNVIKAIADGNVKITPEVLVSGSGEGGSSQGLMALLLGQLSGSLTASAAPSDSPADPRFRA
jgi:regulator of protease activity HflC (stomatin/prohibitin superfamily)